MLQHNEDVMLKHNLLLTTGWKPVLQHESKFFLRFFHRLLKVFVARIFAIQFGQ
jgi:hypothetical protein